jgi:HEPN domain
MPFALNLSDETFNAQLEEIDALMASTDVPITARGIRGWMLFCERHRLEGISMFDPVSNRVMSWFDARYGDRLKLDLDFGHSVLSLRGDIFRFRCPRIFGRVWMFFDPALSAYETNHVGINRPSLLNAPRLVDGITPTYANSLAPDERKRILDIVVRSEVKLARIDDAGMQPFLSEARADLRTSVEQMMLRESQFGPSKWASLQAVEKFLKSYISQNGGSFERNHLLVPLADTAERLGLETTSRVALKTIQCSASVRYDAAAVSKTEAFEAHIAAISICAKVATQLASRSDWKIGVLARGNLVFDDKARKFPAVLVARTKDSVVFDEALEAD